MSQEVAAEDSVAEKIDTEQISTSTMVLYKLDLEHQEV
jgi:hypothetical protein